MTEMEMPVRALDDMADEAEAVCQHKGWSRGWSEDGCYLHLEASEFIEALRGKGSSTPAEEAADVLFVLLSMCRGNGIDMGDVHRIFHAKCEIELSG